MRAASGVECIPLTRDHVDAAFELSSIAGWNQTHADWQLLMELPGACFGIEVERRLASTATLVCYGQTLGWVGMVLTHPDFRRMGFARTLMGHVMEHAASVGLPTLKLDATDEGRALYESFGFRAEQRVERWRHSGVSTGVPIAAGRAADPGLCGLERREFLERLSDDAVASPRGYVLSRPGRIHRYLGPCVALDEDAARESIEEMIARHRDGGWVWDLLPENAAAVRIASALGFEPVRRLTRMVWGQELRGKDDQIFAIGGFEFG
jgi:GNAT superfamily N-acetyltransferase